ncbi:MAG: tripartite tricarboxylate transporter substrate binding protein [Hydrogenophaga sp.]|uniref:tripartite tricarboxylate transporter substrate binding protein n=1 Tax=Hydrogenophaga sp. TaxID=1904254 RepID=UPI00257BAF4D|nr:tripartite tricarboxylate transporter substrate binding protein [Hydrogenophaga sp.]MBL0946232.1 tripartite tricarboxylate transporter substrate binding protein [Hydrogenophaga sp.]
MHPTPQKIRPTRRLIVWAALALCTASALAQVAFPARPVRLIVPTPAGGPSDAAARALAKGMGATLGQEVVVDNRPGGNTGIGAAAVLNAVADGHTLFFALASNAGLPHLSKASPYRSLAEFTPIAAIGGNTQCLVVPAGLAVRTLAEFAAHAKASPRPLLRGSNNVSEDMVAGQVTSALGFALDRVPYKGAPQLLPDLLEGRIQAAVLPVGASVPHVRAGKLVMLGCSMSERIAALPTVPTLAEAGVAVPPLITAHFVLGPPRLPADIVERLASAARQAAQTPEFRQEMERLMIVGNARSPAETRELMQQAEAQYVQFVRETGASID